MDRSQHGGARKGAGRPRTRLDEVEHRTRDRFARVHPLQVTVKLTRDAKGLGRGKLHRVVRNVFVKTCRKRQFRIVHYRLMNNDVHMIVEASSREAMTHGMRSVDIRIGKQVNRALGRKRGKVVADRYRERRLGTARAVRDSLRQVVGGHHQLGGRRLPGPFDPCSSARYFDGWRGRDRASPPGPGDPVAAPITRLLAHLWRRHGLFDPDGAGESS